MYGTLIIWSHNHACLFPLWWSLENENLLWFFITMEPKTWLKTKWKCRNVLSCFYFHELFLTTLNGSNFSLNQRNDEFTSTKWPETMLACWANSSNSEVSFKSWPDFTNCFSSGVNAAFYFEMTHLLSRTVAVQSEACMNAFAVAHVR